MAVLFTPTKKLYMTQHLNGFIISSSKFLLQSWNILMQYKILLSITEHNHAINIFSIKTFRLQVLKEDFMEFV